MMIKTFCALAALLLCCAAQAQDYQMYPPTVQQPREGNSAVGAPTTLADCLTGEETTRVDALLASAPGTPAESGAIEAMLGRRSACRRDMSVADVEALRSQPRPLRGILAGARYVTRYPDAPPPSVANAPPSEIAVEIYNQRVTTAVDVPSEVIRIFGDCMAAAQPMAVDALIRSEAGSAAETAAIGTISPGMGPCLWNGQSIEFSRVSLRAALAEALYRKAIALPVTE